MKILLMPAGLDETISLRELINLVGSLKTLQTKK